MRYLFAVLGAVGLSILIAACGASTGPPPVGSTTGAPVQSQSSQTYSVTTTGQFTLAAPSIGGNQANLQFLAASGGPSSASMTLTTSATSSLPALSKARLPASLRNIKDFTYTAQWFYDVIASASLTFPGPPAWSVTVASPIAGASYFIAYYDPTIPGWNIYGGGTPQGSPGPTATNVTYLFTPAAVASPIVIPTGSPGANFALVAITGTTPTPVPTPTPIPSYPDLVADNNFTAEGTAGQWTLNSTTGWTPCSDPEETPTPRPTATQAVAPSFQSSINVSFDDAAVNPEPTPYGGVQYAALIGRVLGTTGPDEPRGAYGICQQVTIPSNPYMSLAVLEGGNDGSAYIGQKASLVVGGTLTLATDSTPTNPYYVISGATSQVQLFSESICTGQAVGQMYQNCTGSPTTPTWVVKGPYTSTIQSLANQSVTLFIGTWGKSGDSGSSYGVFMYVDNVVLVNLP
ncbi:MAG TPA: hypothetical protein VGG22_17000 [Candidatus Baltobacteraceae bacterium]